MTQFNVDAWLRFCSGKTAGYSFADPEAAAKANPNNSKAARTEYRQGLMNTAQGVIGLFDSNNDNKQSFEEYCNEQKRYAELSGQDNSTFDTEKWQAEFSALDVNNDNYLDYKERANELSILDQNKDKNEQDGSIDTSSFKRIYNDNKTILPSIMKENYADNNITNLGEDGDIKESELNTNAIQDTRNAAYLQNYQDGINLDKKTEDVLQRAEDFLKGINTEPKVINKPGETTSTDSNNLLDKIKQVISSLFNNNQDSNSVNNNSMQAVVVLLLLAAIMKTAQGNNSFTA